MDETDVMNSQSELRRRKIDADLDLSNEAGPLVHDDVKLKSQDHGDSTTTEQEFSIQGDPQNSLNGSTLKEDICSEDEADTSFASRVTEQAELVMRDMREVWEMGWRGWKVMPFSLLPQWLQDNDYLLKGHRPPLPSFSACFKSIFRIHTETGNIWTHLIGCIAFIVVATLFLTRPEMEVQLQEKIVFTFFFASAILCLGFSFMFHTMYCHSPSVGRLFCKLDYCGISILITGSFIPWLYYGFYCHVQPRLIYVTGVVVLGITSMIASLHERFSEPDFRGLRAGVFMAFGLSGLIPAIHYLIAEGFFKAVYEASLGWLLLMAFLYIVGAVLYALRVPERFFPGKCDIWFQSHQIFHVLVIVAAFVHYHGITEMATYRRNGECVYDASDDVEL